MEARTHDPLVSVLVVTYNQKDYLKQALDGILQQQCAFDYEVIVGDDASTDGTRELCLDYAERYPERIRLCLNATNKGLINNYFDIFLQAKGTYIADCGGDDYWMGVTKLQEQVDLLEAHPEVSLVAGSWQFYFQRSGTTSETQPKLEADWYVPAYRGKSAIAEYLNSDRLPRIMLAGSCFRGDWARAAYHEHPECFRGETVVCEDLPLILCLLKKGPFYHSRSLWLRYRVLEQSLSHDPDPLRYRSGFAFKAFRQTLALADTLGVPAAQIAPYATAKSEEFALHAFLSGDAALAETLNTLLRRYSTRRTLKQRVYYALRANGAFARGLRRLFVRRTKYATYR
jgi:glycosyltransferase involved in cell wall biosynthesis